MLKNVIIYLKGNPQEIERFKRDNAHQWGLDNEEKEILLEILNTQSGGTIIQTYWS